VGSSAADGDFPYNAEMSPSEQQLLQQILEELKSMNKRFSSIEMEIGAEAQDTQEGEKTRKQKAPSRDELLSLAAQLTEQIRTARTSDDFHQANRTSNKIYARTHRLWKDPELAAKTA
jgi:hypothetical protein